MTREEFQKEYPPNQTALTRILGQHGKSVITIEGEDMQAFLTGMESNNDPGYFPELRRAQRIVGHLDRTGLPQFPAGGFIGNALGYNWYAQFS